jgi:hypothetical protein
LTINPSNSTPVGYFTLNITGTNSGVTSATTAALIIASSNSLVARLPFDDGTANDASGCGNHGTLINGAAIVTDVTRGKVLSLDGTDDYVDLGNGGLLNLSDDNQATIAAWINPTISKNHNTILSKGEWKEAYALVIKGDTVPDDQLWTGNDTSVFSGGGVPLNTWTHVAMTINSDLSTFYINGQIAGAANQDRGDLIDDTATGVSIGREQYSGSLPAGRWYFNGRLDDVRVYARALSPTEIQSVMDGTPPAPVPRIAGFTLQAAELVLSATNGPPGGNCCLLGSTNVALPLANWVRVATNQFDANGSLVLNVAASLGMARQFFALLVQ